MEVIKFNKYIVAQKNIKTIINIDKYSKHQKKNLGVYTSTVAKKSSREIFCGHLQIIFLRFTKTTK